MSLIPTYYSSQDPGAPALNGVAGSLVELLDAILVDGYGFGDDAKPPLGWTREFTATNKRAYRNNPVTGTGHFLRVDDSAAIGNARHAWMSSFEYMSSIDEGFGRSPLPSNNPNGFIWSKSTTLGIQPRAWFAIGNERFFYLFMDRNNNGLDFALPHAAGDVISFFPNDMHRWFLSGVSNLISDPGTAAAATTLFFSGNNDSASTSLIASNGVFSRSADGLVASPFSHSRGEAYRGTSSFGGVSGAVYPSPIVTGTVMFSRIEQKDAQRSYRGFLPGVLTPTCELPFADLQVIKAEEVSTVANIAPALLAKSFRQGNPNSTGTTGQVVFKIGVEWL